jgi:hypothetical protein
MAKDMKTGKWKLEIPFCGYLIISIFALGLVVCTGLLLWQVIESIINIL